jgi:hypothetical protein
LASKLFKDKNFQAQMSKEEMESALVVEYMKHAVGKTRTDEVRALLGVKRYLGDTVCPAACWR